jgi:hypothetical protein
MPIGEVKRRDKSLFGRAVRVVLLVVLFVVIAGIIAPFITMARYSGQIREALEAALGRSVEFQKLHLTLFSGPGFALDNVTIGEDPRFGLENFAYVPTLEARLRLDKLLLGRIQFSSLRLVDPDLNLVKNADGAWNVVSLVERLSGPRRVPLNLFPAVEVSDGRLNFKLGTRKLTLYISETDLSIYPERSGKLYLQFSGSPARTDRAGNGFGHFRGTANWYLAPPSPTADQLEANLILDRSNLSEMTTLFEGEEAGVDGTVSAHMRVEGPATALRITGDLRLEDVHRWDLLPSSGDDWQIHYGGALDLPTHSLHLATVAPAGSNHAAPLAVQLQIDDFLRSNNWTITTRLNAAPVQNILPLASRMGLSLPQNLSLTGTLEGTVTDSEGAGLSGQVLMHNLAATVPGASLLTAATAPLTIASGHLHLDTTAFQTADGNTFEASGDYFPDTREVDTQLRLTDTPVELLKKQTATWFENGSSDNSSNSQTRDDGAALSMLSDGTVSGVLHYTHPGGTPASWSGQLQFNGATLTPSSVAAPLRSASGRLAFHGADFSIENLAASVSDHKVNGSYRYNPDAKPPERLRLQIPALDLTDLQKLLQPVLGESNLWTRLHFAPRRIPAWLKERNLEGTLSVAQFSAGGVPLGALQSRFAWKGRTIHITSLQSTLPQGSLGAHGTIELAGGSAVYRFNSSLTGYPYKGGLLDATGELQSSGLAQEAAKNLRAAGTFSATDLALSPQDVFDRLSGSFSFSLDANGLNLHLSDIEGVEDNDSYTGEGSSQADGNLLLNLQREGQPARQITTALIPGSAPPAVRPEPQ